MVNVNQINETQQPLTGAKAKPSRAAEGAKTFNTLLNNALEKTNSSKGSAEVSTLEELSAPGFDLQSSSMSVTGKTDDLLGQLQAYALQLEDPKISLKSIAPALEQMNADADALMNEAQRLETGEAELKNIATQTAVTVQTEYVKFQRGDYLS